MFYLQSVHKEKTAVPLQVHIIANFLFFCVCLIIALVAHDPYASKDVKRDILIMYIVYAAFLDFLLVLLLAYLGHAFISTLNSGFFVNNRLLPRSPKVLMLVNWLLITSYTVRGVITLIVGFDTWQLPSDGEVSYNGRHEDTSFLVFLFFLITEITPVFCVIMTMWKYQQRQSTDDPIDHKPRTSMVSIDDRKVKVHITGTSNETSNWWASMYAGWNNMRVDLDEESAGDEYMLFKDPNATSPMHVPPVGVNPLSLGSSPGIAAPSPAKASGTAPSESIPIPPRTDVPSGLSSATPPSLENWLNTDNMTVSSPLRASIPRSASSLEGPQNVSARNRPLPIYPHAKSGSSSQLSREDPNHADSWNPSPKTSKALMDKYDPPDLSSQPLHRPVSGGQSMFDNMTRYDSPAASSNESNGFFIGDPASAISHRSMHRTPTPPINVTLPQSHSKVKFLPLLQLLMFLNAGQFSG